MMSNWTPKIQRSGKQSSRTPGIAKGDNCKASPLEKWMAKASRSYKHPQYSQWCKSKNGTKGQKGRVR